MVRDGLRARGAAQPRRQMLARFVALCVAAVVLVGTLTAGHTYLWCSMMQQRLETCCCETRRSELEAPAIGQSQIENGCCQQYHTGGIDMGRVASESLDVSAPLAVAVTTPTFAISVVGASPMPHVPRPITHAKAPRAGPQTASDRCARLQVFHC
jgi:hypothetical protein